MITMNDYLQFLIGKEGSDLHLCSGRRPYIRIHGELIDTEFPVLSSQRIDALINDILNEEQMRRIIRTKELDISYMMPDISRFRINIYKQRGSYAVTIRVIPFNAGTFESLGIPQGGPEDNRYKAWSCVDYGCPGQREDNYTCLRH
jgi:twitching motility protein PilT